MIPINFVFLSQMAGMYDKAMFNNGGERISLLYLSGFPVRSLSWLNEDKQSQSPQGWMFNTFQPNFETITVSICSNLIKICIS